MDQIESRFGWAGVEHSSFADWDEDHGKCLDSISINVYGDPADSNDFYSITLTYKQARKLAYRLLGMAEGE